MFLWLPWITSVQSKRILIDMKLNYCPNYFLSSPIRWSNFWLDGAVKAQVALIKLMMAEYSIWLLHFLGPGGLSANSQSLPGSQRCLITTTNMISNTWASPCTSEILWNRPISALTFCFLIKHTLITKKQLLPFGSSFTSWHKGVTQITF